MCRAVPARVLRVDGDVAWIEDEGRESPVSLLGVEGIVPGDYVFHHAGLALARVDPEEAAAILAAYAELAELDALERGNGS
ncbi:MAG TPA: HypC/HybG/HupF family hydrogenase formation chaperone [Thermomicrobiaceae bacterium]|nr:HypC/HybG/HupF family hydrogenase formation chaperone [Thermomicrobiaceae bacterium]